MQPVAGGNEKCTGVLNKSTAGLILSTCGHYLVCSVISWNLRMPVIGVKIRNKKEESKRKSAFPLDSFYQCSDDIPRLSPMAGRFSSTARRRKSNTTNVIANLSACYAGLVLYDGLVLRHEGLHDNPTDEVGNGTEAEHNHVGTGFALVAHEGELRTHALGVGKELT